MVHPFVSRSLSRLRALPGRIWSARHSGSALWSISILVVILASLMYFKVQLTLCRGRPTWDAGQYTDIAKHVRDGKGLTTDLSLFHDGGTHFPRKTKLRPLWPLIYGYTARLLPLYAVASWLPTFLYLTSLIFAYLWGASLFPQQLFPDRFPGFNAGHVAALMLGLHDHYFLVTSQPYTDSLAYTLVFAVLWRGRRIWSKPTLLGGIELGTWLGLCMLTRRQLVILPIAALVTFAVTIASSPERRRYLVMLGGVVAVCVLLVGLHFWYSRDTHAGFGDYSGALHVLKLKANPEPRVLSPLTRPGTEHVSWDFVSHYILARLHGFPIAFKLTGSYSYHRSYYLFQYALLAALPFLLLLGVTHARRGSLGALGRWLRSSSSPEWIFIITLALGGFFSLHAIMSGRAPTWLFHRRHALTAFFLFFLSLVFLLRHKRFPAAVIGVIILCSSTYLGFRSIDNRVEKMEKREMKGPEEYKHVLVNWLQEQSDRRGGIVVAMSDPGPQMTGFLTDNVHYHGVYKKTTIKDIERFIDTLGIDYLILGANPKKYRFGRDRKRFIKMFRRVDNKSGYVIYEPRPKWLKQHGLRKERSQ